SRSSQCPPKEDTICSLTRAKQSASTLQADVVRTLPNSLAARPCQTTPARIPVPPLRFVLSPIALLARVSALPVFRHVLLTSDFVAPPLRRLAQNALHLFGRESTHCLCADVAQHVRRE